MPADLRFVHTRAMLGVSLVALTLPLAGLALLLWRPELDVHWRHQPSHFWLVLGAAALSAVIAHSMGAAALRRRDARVLLASLAFLVSAGFLGLHALATPGVLLDAPNAGFVIATPVGLALGSVLAVGSSVEDESADRVAWLLRVGRRLRLGLVLLMAAWAVASVGRLPPLDSELELERADGVLLALVVPAVVLYAVGAARYLRIWRRRPSVMLLAMASAFVLLAEAMVAVGAARSWALSWWEWHALLLAAFALVALGARVQWHEDRYVDLYLDHTVASTRDVSVLFADLQGFTRFSEDHSAEEVTAMLNAYFEVAIPPVVAKHGGELDRIIGDALMVTFNKHGDQPDHARRAAAAGLALQAATGRVAAEHPRWPRFRVGINSGPVSVGLLGTEGGRTHTVIGDVVNVAARLEAQAPVGGVAVGPRTRELLSGGQTEPMGRLTLKGKAEPIEAYLLRSLDASAKEAELS